MLVKFFTASKFALAALTIGISHSSGAMAAPPHVSAQAAIVIDARTGSILFEKNAFLQKDPASITKMMTALLVIEKGHLNRVVVVSKKAALTIGSSMHIGYRQRYTEMDLLRGLLMRSGNDAAVALAEADAGSVDRFVARMNFKAQELGAFNTAFENPNGLTAPGHYSSAYDLALIAQAAMREPTFRSVVATREDVVTEQNSGRSRTIHNTNQLLYGFPGADGVKTGTTNAAGKCLAASATRQDRQLIAVVLNSPNRFGDAARLLQWGFANWTTREVARPGQKIAMVPVQNGHSAAVAVHVAHALWFTYPVGEAYRVHIALPALLTAPVVKGVPVGRITVTVPNQPPWVEPLIAGASVTKRSAHRSFWRGITDRFLNHPR